VLCHPPILNAEYKSIDFILDLNAHFIKTCVIIRSGLIPGIDDQHNIRGILMKIALPTRDSKIDNHFGHCDHYTVYTVDDNTKEIISKEILQSPEGCGCKSDIAFTLADMKVTLMLAGNMGNGAKNVLNRQGIAVVRGCSGDVKAVAKSWLSGTLTDSGIGCEHHDCE